LNLLQAGEMFQEVKFVTIVFFVVGLAERDDSVGLYPPGLGGLWLAVEGELIVFSSEHMGLLKVVGRSADAAGTLVF